MEFGRLLNQAGHLSALALKDGLEGAQKALLEAILQERREDGHLLYRRWGGYFRTFYTKLGEVTLWAQRVRHRETGETFAPLLRALGLGKRRYTPELRLGCAELATRTSYEEAAQAVERILHFRIPRRTIWNFVQEFARVVRSQLGRSSPPSPERVLTQTHSTDSTFVRGRKRRQQLEVHVAVTQGQDHRVQFEAVRVGGRPGAVLEGQEVQRLVTDDAPGLRAIEAEIQALCHVHFARHLADLLGEEGIGLAEREEVVRPVRGLLSHLRNSVEAHRGDGGGGAVRYRVQVTLEELGALGHRLQEGGCPRSAGFVLRELRALVVFAEVGGGLWMSATTNGVERVMGMLAHRCKRAWAHWGSGLENMAVVLLTRKLRPKVYGPATRRYLRSGGYQ